MNARLIHKSPSVRLLCSLQRYTLRMVNWHEVTPFSRMLAIIVFVGVIPVLFFYLGMQYQDMQEIQSVMHSYSFPRLEHYSATVAKPNDQATTSVDTQ